MASSPAVHRIVTGHNSEGKAIIESDTKLTPLNPYTNAPLTSDSSEPFAFAVVHRTSGFPASNTEPPVEYHGKKISLEDKVGTTCRIVDFPPSKMKDGAKIPEGFMHRTQSLDFGVVLKGRIMLELDDGVETEVGCGFEVNQDCPSLLFTVRRIAGQYTASSSDSSLVRIVPAVAAYARAQAKGVLESETQVIGCKCLEETQLPLLEWEAGKDLVQIACLYYLEYNLTESRYLLNALTSLRLCIS